MHGKTVLITGGTGGIGKQTAIGLAKLGAHVVVSGRDAERGKAAVRDIQEASGHQNIDLILSDLSLISQTHRLIDTFRSRFSRLDVLINNAGMIPASRVDTEEGFQAALVVNHLVPALLTYHLLPLLRASGNGRVINVTGGMPGAGGVDIANLRKPLADQAKIGYGPAKNIMMAGSYAFAQHLQGSGVTLNVTFPGLADTAMTRNMVSTKTPVARLMGALFSLMLANARPEKAARSSIYLASSADVEGISGSYFNPKGKALAWPGSIIRDDLPEQIWKLTLEALRLEPLTAVAMPPL
ncbi:MAG: SDR family NAD(P)-dependent oxidoreductase [Pleurocapsa minor GSE-CHR-MK-17-07R]|jgi:NAD(P)-dependent dehydrogenase (short-subunit alcohol dehydrogenase family)|nr:SDR family NAD(P)-dependent oxidoreductase [Pleurocapsa minor GSE-CHR-MK 17-07R]